MVDTDDTRRTTDDGRRTTPRVWHKLPTGELKSHNLSENNLNDLEMTLKVNSEKYPTTIFLNHKVHKSMM